MSLDAGRLSDELEMKSRQRLVLPLIGKPGMKCNGKRTQIINDSTLRIGAVKVETRSSFPGNHIENVKVDMSNERGMNAARKQLK